MYRVLRSSEDQPPDARTFHYASMRRSSPEAGIFKSRVAIVGGKDEDFALLLASWNQGTGEIAPDWIYWEI
jgi:hypothetical protein